MLTREQIEAAPTTLDLLAKRQLITAFRASSEYRERTWIYPDLVEVLNSADALQSQILNAGISLYESYGDGTVAIQPTNSNDGKQYSVVDEREALVRYLLSTLYEAVGNFDVNYPVAASSTVHANYRACGCDTDDWIFERMPDA